MNPRRVHELISKHFPAVDAASLDWQNVMDRDGMRVKLLTDLIKQHIHADEILVEVHRKLGDFLQVDDAVEFIGKHVGEGQIKVTDRDFRGFVVVAMNGVAAGWSTTSNIRLNPDNQSVAG
jgi:hypothetical protein